MKALSIGYLSDSTGVRIPTIRYYESIGLMPRVARTSSNRRVYGKEEVQRLRFIRHARELGFGIDDIRALLELQGMPETSCKKVDNIARQHLDQVERRLRQLSALKRELARMLNSCDHNRIGDCRIIETLQDHTNCKHHS